MKIQDLKCRTTSSKGSIRCISSLQELEDSNSNLVGETELESCESRPGSMKQIFSDEEEDEWKQNFSSTQLEFAEISNYHGSELASTVLDLQEFSTILLQQIFNNSCRWWLTQGTSKGNDEIRWKELKKFEKIWENLRWKWVWIWNCDYA